MTDFEKTLMRRNDMSRDEAYEERNRARSEIMSMIENGASYSDVEDLLLDDYGLEMDYLLDLI